MYMVGMYANGYIADRCNLRYFLCVSMIVCGLNCIAFGTAKWLRIHSLWYFISLEMIAGYAFASMPALIAVLGHWFGTTKKGLIFGIWNWNSSVGNILGSVTAGKRIYLINFIT